jgi:hypothetical protein
VDPQQDWTLIRGENANGYTVLEFWRKWVTCDERDRDILVTKTLHYWDALLNLLFTKKINGSCML